MAVPALRAWKGLAPAVVFSALSVVLWGYFVWTGTVSAIWPMLGVSNQLLAAFALAIGTSVLINMGKARYVWCTLIPLAFMCVNTLTAGWMNLGINYLAPQLKGGAPPGEEKRIAFEEGDANTQADRALARFTGLIARFDRREQPFRSLVQPMWKVRYGDYDHLARVKEWSLAEERNGP